MSKGLVFVSGLIFGGIAGFMSARFALNEKYKRISDEEIASVKDTYRKVISQKEERAQTENTIPSNEIRNVADKAKNKPDISRYMKYSKTYGGTQGGDKTEKKPYVITPEDFGTREGYERISLTWFADKVLADDENRRLDEDEMIEKVGEDFESHFGEYEDDSVFIRNEELECDYEILMDVRKYSDVLEDRPYLKD